MQYFMLADFNLKKCSKIFQGYHQNVKQLGSRSGFVDSLCKDVSKKVTTSRQRVK